MRPRGERLERSVAATAAELVIPLPSDDVDPRMISGVFIREAGTSSTVEASDHHRELAVQVVG